MSKHYLDSPGSEADITVLGIGNLLMGDEGVGLHALKVLQKTYTFSPSINFIDGGTTGLDLIPYFEECKKMIIIDAMDSQKEPGYIEVLIDDEIRYRFNTKLSLHHAGLSDVLSVLQLQEIPFPKLTFIGVQPKLVEMQLELSNEIESVMDNIIEIAVKKLTDWNINCKKITE